MKNLNLIAFALVLSLFSCDSDELKENSNYPEVLLNTWFETDDTNGEYRPSDFMDFLPSRYRQSYAFYENNICDYLVTSPIDAHYTVEGKWEYNSENEVLNIYDPQGQLHREFIIIEISKNLLHLEYNANSL